MLPLSAGVAHSNPEDDLDNDNDDDDDDVAVRSTIVITAHQPSLSGKQQAHCNTFIAVTIHKQECTPVECVPYRLLEGCLPRSGCLPRGCLPRGVCSGGGVCPGVGVWLRRWTVPKYCSNSVYTSSYKRHRTVQYRE